MIPSSSPKADICAINPSVDCNNNEDSSDRCKSEQEIESENVGTKLLFGVDSILSRGEQTNRSGMCLLSKHIFCCNMLFDWYLLPLPIRWWSWVFSQSARLFLDSVCNSRQMPINAAWVIIIFVIIIIAAIESWGANFRIYLPSRGAVTNNVIIIVPSLLFFVQHRTKCLELWYLLESVGAI